MMWLKRFVNDIEVVGLSHPIKDIGIRLSLQHRIKLSDAIISATAISLDAILLSNDHGLLGIPGLRIQHLALHEEIQ